MEEGFTLDVNRSLSGSKAKVPESFSARSASKSIGNGCMRRPLEGEDAELVTDRDGFEKALSSEHASRKFSKRLEEDWEAQGEVFAEASDGRWEREEVEESGEEKQEQDNVVI